MGGLSQALEAISKVSDDLFATDFDGIEVVFRLPSIKVAKQYSMLLKISQKPQDEVEIYDFIFRQVVEDDWLAKKEGQIPAGVVVSIAKLVLFLSGVDENCLEYTEHYLDVQRQEINGLLSEIKGIICCTFPGYTFESLDKLNYHQILHIFAQAEKVQLREKIIEIPYSLNPSKGQKENYSNVPGDTIEKIIAKDQRKKSNPAIEEKIRQQAIKRAKEQDMNYQRKIMQRGQK